MKPLTILSILFSTFILISCKKESEQVTTNITNQKDYNNFLEIKENKSIDFAKAEIAFWQKKYDAAPNQISFLNQIATNYSILFEQSAKIEYLYKTEELLIKSNEALKYSNTGAIRSLARNYITQHRFKEALVLANKALAIGDGMFETQKLLFDVQMELGNYTEADKALTKIKNFKDFDYLLRLAKWNDHKGDLKSAINLMEKAKEQAEFNNNKTLKVWSYSNLGDMNGHAGNIKESYNYYLKTLSIDPNNSYALKGIAWITFSHEKNTAEAKRIIDKISVKHNSPDFYLFKSEIAKYENNPIAKDQNVVAYFTMLSQNNYGAMYNKYNTILYAEDKLTVNKALEISKIEIENRPTPDSYDLLAWSYYNLGEIKKALEIEQKYVVGKSFEPKLNYHLATIYKANNLLEKVKPIKEDLKSSSFELGPNLSKVIENL